MNAAANKRQGALSLAADLCFFTYLATGFVMAHTGVSQAVQALFCLSAVLLFVNSGRAYLSYWFFCYAGLTLWGLIGTRWAVDAEQAMAMVKTLVINLITLLCLYQYFLQRRLALKRVFYLYMAAAALLVLHIIGFIIAENPIHLGLWRLGQFAGINPNFVGAVLVPAFAMALHLLFSGTKRTRFLWLAALAALAGLILWTGSRKALVSIMLVTAVYVLWTDKKHFLRDIAILFALAALAGVLVMKVPALYEALGWRIEALVRALLLGTEVAPEWSFMERSQMIQDGWALFLKAPLTGYGLDCFRYATPWATYSHCNYIELLVGGGVPALLLYYVPLLAAVMQGLLAGRRDGAARMAALLGVSLLLTEFASVTYFERPDLFMIVLLLALTRIAKDKKDDGAALMKYIKNPARVCMLLGNRGLFDRMPDEKFLKLMYRGHLGKKLHLDRPVTFNEKLNWLKLHDRREIYTQMSDKYAAREIIRARIGEEYLVPLLGVWERAEDVDFDALPERFVIKTTHDSGGTKIVLDKSRCDLKKLRGFLSKRLKKKYWLTTREHQYEHIPPRIIAEAFIGDAAGNPPADYKFFCFNGRVEMILVCAERRTGVKFYYCDRAGDIIPCTELCKSVPKDFVVWPREKDEMIALAERIADPDMPCLRVDFYVTDAGIKAGEITLHDYAGFCPLFVDGGDELLGRFITAV